MVYTATSHQEATEMFWLCLREAIMSSVCIDQLLDARLLSFILSGCFRYCGYFLCISSTQQVCQNFYCWLVSWFHDLEENISAV